MTNQDPLSAFLQNGSKITQDAIPINYRIQPAAPQQQAGFSFDMLNPMNWLKSQIQQNPQMQQVMDVIEKNGGDPKTAFYNECKARGQDPDQILQQVKTNPLFQKFMNK